MGVRVSGLSSALGVLRGHCGHRWHLSYDQREEQDGSRYHLYRLYAGLWLCSRRLVVVSVVGTESSSLAGLMCSQEGQHLSQETRLHKDYLKTQFILHGKKFSHFLSLVKAKGYVHDIKTN